jgi:hypothetical protein
MHVDEGLVNNQTFAVKLADAGYVVGFFGKTLNNCPLLPFAGVSAWLANGGGSYNNPSFAIKGIDGLPDGMLHFDANHTATLGLLGSSYSTSVIGNYSLEWIKKVAKQERPFMAYIGTKAPREITLALPCRLPECGPHVSGSACAHRSDDPFDPADWYKD